MLQPGQAITTMKDRAPEQRFETPAGEDIVFDRDFYGNQRTTIVAGPF